MAAGGARMELLRQGVPCGPTAERSGAFPASHTLHCLCSCHRQSQRHSLGSSAGGRPARQLQAARSCTAPARTCNGNARTSLCRWPAAGTAARQGTPRTRRGWREQRCRMSRHVTLHPCKPVTFAAAQVLPCPAHSRHGWCAASKFQEGEHRQQALRRVVHGRRCAALLCWGGDGSTETACGSLPLSNYSSDTARQGRASGLALQALGRADASCSRVQIAMLNCLVLYQCEAVAWAARALMPPMRGRAWARQTSAAIAACGHKQSLAGRAALNAGAWRCCQQPLTAGEPAANGGRLFQGPAAPGAAASGAERRAAAPAGRCARREPQVGWGGVPPRTSRAPHGGHAHGKAGPGSEGAIVRFA